MLGVMYSEGPALAQLSRYECLRLMASVPIGRIIYTRHALPAVEVVNFALDQGDIVIRTDRSGKLATAIRGAIVAFEADCLDVAQRTGWSVTAVGPAQEVTDPSELDRLRKIGLSSWVPGTREHFIRIAPTLLNGRRIRAYAEPGPNGLDACRLATRSPAGAP
jgi:nitroimidazol reductase NimA-like FMN-containing flavoprotein (pyridoxamine 5'-phosphate oxidase superfamily)